MTAEKIPPLPELEILESTRKVSSQETIDHALRIIYERRPDLLIRIAEQEKKDLGITPVTDDLYRFLRAEEVKREISIPTLNTRTSITREIRRRVRVMYGLPI